MKHLVEIYTTPKQLRKWADYLEKKWRESVVGDDVPRVVTYPIESSTGIADTKVEFMIDQVKVREEEKDEAGERG